MTVGELEIMAFFHPHPEYRFASVALGLGNQ